VSRKRRVKGVYRAFGRKKEMGGTCILRNSGGSGEREGTVHYPKKKKTAKKEIFRGVKRGG